MAYRCLNCGKETPGFICDCGKDSKIWDSSLRKNHNKALNKKKNLKN